MGKTRNCPSKPAEQGGGALPSTLWVPKWLSEENEVSGNWILLINFYMQKSVRKATSK